SPYVVELEKDLSFKQQFLDVVILRKEQDGTVDELPDGFDNLTGHNLLSYKSLHEAFDDWALNELIGHYVNYRKQVSPSLDNLLPEIHFQLYGVSTRYPQKLNQQVKLQRLKQGVYELKWGAENIRIIVLSEIPEGQHNAVLRLFSAKRETVLQAQNEYQMRQPDMSTIVQQLFENYQLENIDMAYTLQDFQKDYILDHLNLLSADEVLKRYSPDDRLKNLSPDDIVNHLSPSDLKKLLDKLEKILSSRK
ncbi:MAG: hypothetical protein Q8L68_03640, partial [Methylococcales bacterium]|nr:hypothetical protein [Methylococcales bacterium]